MDFSPPGSSVHEFSQARILEWIAIYFSRVSSKSIFPALAGRFFIIEPPVEPLFPIFLNKDKIINTHRVL